MGTLRVVTDRLELKPLPAQAAAALPEDREAACRTLDARISAEWPDPHLVGVLRRHAGTSVDTECFGVWVMIERCSGTVIGDIGFHGPPDDTGTIEVGYSVIPSRRRPDTQPRRPAPSLDGHVLSRASMSSSPAATPTTCPPFGPWNGSASAGPVRRTARPDGAMAACPVVPGERSYWSRRGLRIGEPNRMMLPSGSITTPSCCPHSVSSGVLTSAPAAVQALAIWSASSTNRYADDGVVVTSAGTTPR